MFSGRSEERAHLNLSGIDTESAAERSTRRAKRFYSVHGGGGNSVLLIFSSLKNVIPHKRK